MFKGKIKKDESRLKETDSNLNFHAMDTGEVLEAFEVDPIKGLPSKEIIFRLERDGLNILIEKGRANPIILFLSQFLDVLIGLLAIAAIISLIFGDVIESIVILSIILLNGIIGFIQEFQAEKSLEELKKMVSKEVRVIRDNSEHVIDSKELVIGDIVLIEAGEKVPADMRLIESTSLKVDESVLTGESISLSKDSKQLIAIDAVIGDRRNMLFMGTTITYGRTKAVVTNIGMKTEMGKIAALMQKEKEEPTPLQKNLNKLGKWLGATCLFICVIVFVASMFHEGNSANWKEALENALALAVSAVPEGLPTAITLTYAIGVRIMAKQNAIVSRLPAVETLGVVDVICSDKTGTLTKNEMTVTEIQTLNHTIKVTGKGYLPKGEFQEDNVKIDPLKTPELEKILRASQLCNNSKVNYDEKTKNIEVMGDPTEVALVVLTRKANLYDDDLFSREVEVFFDSQRKRMTTVNRILTKNSQKDKLIAYSKGSPGILLQYCNYISIDGRVVPLDDGIKDKIMQMNDKMASSALRVLAMAYRFIDERLIKVDKEDFLSEMEKNIERDLIFVGIVGMIDPARPEVRNALIKCNTAGIKAVMVTGDQKVTAEAIAKDIGLIRGDKWKTITGTELETINDADLLKIIDDVNVFARVSPEQKYRIVSTFQQKGHIVATTGDGVNDAPAIKKAEIGVAMGIQGTDVTREAAQIVLADDNFATIVTAIERGRTIFENMLKFIRYLIASNFDEILVVFIAVVILGLRSPFTAIQILWINLVTDGLPAIALSVDPPHEGIMREPPRKKNQGFMRDIYIFAIIAGFLAFCAGMSAFLPLAYIAEAVDVDNGKVDGVPPFVESFGCALARVDRIGDLTTDQWYAEARTMNFTMSIVFEMFNVFVTRSGFERSTFTLNPINNKWIWFSIGVAMGLQLMVIYVPMKSQNGIHNTVFDSMPMHIYEWLIVIVVCLIAVCIMEFSKFIIGKYIFKTWIGRSSKIKAFDDATDYGKF